jgi:predicted amidohydrolase YtcJ
VEAIMFVRVLAVLVGAALLSASRGAEPTAEADLILHHGKIVTVDLKFSIQQALAIKDGRILRVGTNDEVLRAKGKATEMVDLGGKAVLPGLIDSHVHPNGACMTEFDHPIPEMESIADVLAYVKDRAKALAEGEWIEVHQVFITRLREQRYPTREELDKAAPKNPVLFATGPDASLNSLALQRSKIDKDFKVTDGGPGYAEKDAKTGEPTGILRSCTRYVKVQSSGRKPTDADRTERLLQLFKDYNSVGLTAIIDRSASAADAERYHKLLDKDRLTLRIAVSRHVDTIGPVEAVQKRIRQVAEEPLCKGGPMLRIVGIKTFLDGGMLTGSAYMRGPWGVSKIYSITDPKYQGVLFIPRERLLPIVQTAVESGLQFTAHSVGDGAVHTLLDVYEEVAKKTPLDKTRPCITHSNFMSKEAIEKAARLGVAVDIQPAWLYLDARTLTAQFGNDRLRYFQPLRSLFAAGVLAGGGSDHMQKIGSLRSVNPYNPFLGMWTTITRQARWFEGQLHPEEALSREQTIRFYTINNARLLFLEDKVGSLEEGKLADFIVLDRDLLTCPVDGIKDAQCLRTYVNGKLVYERK